MYDTPSVSKFSNWYFLLSSTEGGLITENTFCRDKEEISEWRSYIKKHQHVYFIKENYFHIGNNLLNSNLHIAFLFFLERMANLYTLVQ